MERAVEDFVIVTALVIGLSHLVHAPAWAELYGALTRAGRVGAFTNGAVSLVPGAVVVAAHGGTWAGPTAVLTLLGWALVVKGAICFLAPGLALRSMAAGAASPRKFMAAGLLLIGVSGVLAYARWVR